MTITEKNGVTVIATYESASCTIQFKGMVMNVSFELIEHLHHSVMAEMLSKGEDPNVIDKS